MVKTIDEFDRAASTIAPATLDYLASLEWILARATSAESMRRRAVLRTAASRAHAPTHEIEQAVAPAIARA